MEKLYTKSKPIYIMTAESNNIWFAINSSISPHDLLAILKYYHPPKLVFHGSILYSSTTPNFVST